MRILGISILACMCALFLAGCGGGGGGGGGSADTPQLLGRFTAALSGASETSVSEANARGYVIVRLVDDGTLEFWASAEPAWAADVNGMHVHRGGAGVDGAVVVDLLGGGAAFDAATGTVHGTVSIDEALAAEIAADPAAFYVNIHTTDAPNGFVRAQLGAAAAIEWHALLRGDQEVTPVEPNARGAATFSIAADGSIDFVVAMQSPVVLEVISGHIHVGAAGVAGAPLIDLDLANATIDAANGTMTGTIQADPASIVRVIAAPADFYVNVHTNVAPNGVARGQVGTGAVELWTALKGDEETTVVDADARGGVSLELRSFTSGTAMFAVPPAQDITDITAAHVHEGGAGIAGTAVIDLMAGADLNISESSESAEGTISFDQTLLTRMMASPSSFYVNLHTAAAPDGLVRGQLTDDPQTFFSQMRGDAVTNVVDADAEGLISVVVNAVHECTFTITMTRPDAADINGASLHDGDPGEDGPMLVDLFLDGGHEVSGNAVTGRAVVGGRTFSRMLAAPEQFYVSAATASAPDGIVRGQAAQLSGDLPPAGLTYTSPVSYPTDLLISNNVPTSSGGAITSFSVDPPLPAGLSLHAVTGTISGRPTAATAQADYVVTASNASGSTTATVTITITQLPPSTLSYGGAKSFGTGSPITPITPTSTGGKITSYGVNPPLPAGLSLSTTTGAVSGTPTVATAQATYVVTGSNSAGSVQANLVLTITQSLQPPSNLTYSTPSPTYGTGTAITNNTPTISGGAVASWSVSPALPAGLSIDTSTGVISGTPTTITAQANYTVTATNAAGNTTAVLSITVQLGAPTNLTYSPSQVVGYAQPPQSIATMNPSSQGGTVSSYSISPSLPAGLSLNTSTGVISGTPTATSGNSNYTVTATNAAGSTTAQVVISVPY